MATLDLVLFLAFGTLALLGLSGAIFFFLKALRVSGEKNGDLKMFAWAVASMFSLIVAGMSTAYILLPIVFHK